MPRQPGGRATTRVNPAAFFCFFLFACFSSAFYFAKRAKRHKRISKPQSVECAVDQVILLPAASVSRTWSPSLPSRLKFSLQSGPCIRHQSRRCSSLRKRTPKDEHEGIILEGTETFDTLSVCSYLVIKTVWEVWEGWGGVGGGRGGRGGGARQS